MGTNSVSSWGLYLAFGLQSVGMAIGWQYITYFLKHELGVTSFILMTTIFAAPSFVMILAMSFWGAISDRVGKRKPFLLLGFTGYFATYLLYSFVSTSTEYFVIAVVGTFFSSAALPAGQALMTTDTHRKGERLALLLVAQSAGWFCGALFSGVLYDIVGMFVLYRIAALVSVVALVACALFVNDIALAFSTGESALGFIHLLGRPGMVRLLMAAILSTLGMSAVSSVTAIIISDELGGPTAFVGYANSAATALAALITGYVGRVIDRKGPVGVLISGLAMYCMFALAFALVTDPVSATILYALPLYPLVVTATSTFAALISGEEERGRAMGLVNGASNAGAAVGPIVGGVFADLVFHRAQPVSWINLVFNMIALVLAISLIGVGRKLHAEAVAAREASAEGGVVGEA
ncbi:MAG: MFS transporter [Candidatus Thorarchaeota archaeon]